MIENKFLNFLIFLIFSSRRRNGRVYGEQRGEFHAAKNDPKSQQ